MRGVKENIREVKGGGSKEACIQLLQKDELYETIRKERKSHTDIIVRLVHCNEACFLDEQLPRKRPMDVCNTYMLHMNNLTIQEWSPSP